MKEKLKKTIKFIFKAIFIIGCCHIVLSASLAILFFFVAPTEEKLKKRYNNISEYSKAKEHFCGKKKFIEHFPKEISNNAKNFLMDKPHVCFFDSDSFFVSFEADDNYIQNELKKHKFIKTEGPYETEEQYSDNPIHHFAIYNLKLKKTNFIFYTIEDNTTIKSFSPVEYGIAVNPKTNTILYYYASLD